MVRHRVSIESWRTAVLVLKWMSCDILIIYIYNLLYTHQRRHCCGHQTAALCIPFNVVDTRKEMPRTQLRGVIHGKTVIRHKCHPPNTTCVTWKSKCDILYLLYYIILILQCIGWICKYPCTETLLMLSTIPHSTHRFTILNILKTLRIGYR